MVMRGSDPVSVSRRPLPCRSVPREPLKYRKLVHHGSGDRVEQAFVVVAALGEIEMPVANNSAALADRVTCSHGSRQSKTKGHENLVLNLAITDGSICAVNAFDWEAELLAQLDPHRAPLPLIRMKDPDVLLLPGAGGCHDFIKLLRRVCRVAGAQDGVTPVGHFDEDGRRTEVEV